MALEWVDTRARAKSRGNRFGLEGNLYLWMVGGAFLAIGTVMFTPEAWGMAVRLPVGAIPLAIISLYVVLLKHKQPPHYDADLLAAFLNGRSFGPAKRQPVHPVVAVRARPEEPNL